MAVAADPVAPAGRGATRPGFGIVAPPWHRAVPVVVAVVDLAVAVVAVLLALRLRFGVDVPDLYVGRGAVGHVPAALVVAAAWPGVLFAHGAYRTVVLGRGVEEVGRVAEAGLTLFAAVAVLHLLLSTNLSVQLVTTATALLVVLTLAVRLAVDRVVRRARLQGRWRHRAVVYGTRAEAAALARQLDRPGHGVEVVGTCLVDGDGSRAGAGRRGGVNGDGAPVPGGRSGAGGSGPVGTAVLEAMTAARADMLAVAGGTSPSEVRALAWALEGTGAELMIAPAVPDLAQQSVTVEPVGGAVLLRVQECRQRRGRLLVKSAIDRVGAALLLALLAPVLAAIAVAVKLSSPGPVLYRQERVGQYGRTFEFFKFRSMVTDADAQLDRLASRNETDGLLFKIREDPRVTRVGRFLRRTSLDELPQLWNVLRGDMSLVGPRPLPVDAEEFEGDARRRLRVRPGITGLWQVSGRSELGWEETVALDMYYVDHWSLAMDLAILVRTPLAVLRGTGAY